MSAKPEQSFSTVPLVRKPPVRPMSPPSTTPRKPAAAGGSTLEVPPVMPRRPKRAQHASSAKSDPKLMRRSLSLNQVDVVQIPGSVTVKADTTEHLVDACQQYLDQMAEEPRPPPKGMEAADEIVVDGVDVVTVGGEKASSGGYGTHPRAMKKNISRTWVPAMKRMFERRAGSVEHPLSEIRLRIQMTPQRTRRSASPAVAVATPQPQPREEEDCGGEDSAKSEGTESVSSFVALSVDNSRSLHSAENDGTTPTNTTDGDEEDDERAKNKGFLNKCMVRVKRAMSNSN